MRLFHKTQSANKQATMVLALNPDEPADWSSKHDRFLCAKLNGGTPDEQAQAFGALYDRYELMIRNYVMKQLNYSEDDSIEVIGDTWLVFWRERMNFQWRDDAQTEQPLQSWLYGIARNRVKSKVRQNIKRKRTLP